MADDDHEAERDVAAEAAGTEEAGKERLARLRQTNRSEKVLLAAQTLRKLLPGDPQLGDPLSTSGGEPTQALARKVGQSGAETPTLLREMGLGALQVWQAASEAQGRGRGDQEVTILFTDLVEFSPWALEAGDEAALELLHEAGEVQEDAIAQGGGRVVKRLGDGLMAVFPDPEGAVRAATDAVASVGQVQCDGYQPALRAGLHHGRPRKVRRDYLGVDVNVAARVAEAASGGEVLITGPTRDRLPETTLSFKRKRFFRAKGAPKELEVYAVELP